MERVNGWARVGLGAIFAAAIAFGSSPARADTLLVQAGDDTAPYSFLPSLARFAHPTLYAFEGEDENQVAHAFETYVRFDVSPSALPPGHMVDSATFFITYAFDVAGFGTPSTSPGELHCHPVTEDWVETTLTWNHRPTIGPEFDAVSNITGFGVLTCDATELVRDWLDEGAPNYGIALTNPTDRGLGMHSFEASVSAGLKANLLITTVEAPNVPAAPWLARLAYGLALGVLARRMLGSTT